MVLLIPLFYGPTTKITFCIFIIIIFTIIIVDHQRVLADSAPLGSRLWTLDKAPGVRDLLLGNTNLVEP